MGPGEGCERDGEWRRRRREVDDRIGSAEAARMGVRVGWRVGRVFFSSPLCFVCFRRYRSVLFAFFFCLMRNSSVRSMLMMFLQLIE